MGVSPWEFNSPLRHHKKINGLEGIFFLLARFLFSSAAILPHYAPTFGKLPKKFCLSAWQSSRLLRGKSSTHIAFLIGKLLMGVLTERLRGAFLFSQHPPSSFFVSSKKNPPPSRVAARKKGGMPDARRRGWFPRYSSKDRASRSIKKPQTKETS